MQIKTSSLPLTLRTPFRIAHGVSTERTNALVTLGEGLGEAGLPPYLGTDVEAVSEWIDGLEVGHWNWDDTPPISSWLSDLPPGPAAARCALDLALHDHWGKSLGHPIYKLFGLDPKGSPATFRTISIPETLEELDSSDSLGYPRLKVKLGSGSIAQDAQIIKRIRSQSDASLCVDANGAWSIPDAVRIIPQLAEYNVEFIEQPIANTDPEDWHLLRRLLTGSNLPLLVADESARSAEDIIALAGAADAINVKLAKCGGLASCRELIGLARSLDLKVVLGCMVESSLAITAAAHIASLADFVDLDGADLLASDPFSGVRFDDGVPVLPTGPGLGVSRSA